MKNCFVILLSIFGLLIAFSSCDTHELSEPGMLVPLTVKEDPTLPSILVNNTLLHAETYGQPSDPMLVILHGGPGADYRSLLNCKQFADDGFYVVFYDQRGSGLSERHDADIYTTQLFIDDLRAVIQHFKSSPDQLVILMGHSWGAMLAAAYVNDYPDEIAGLVMMEPGGLTFGDMEDYIERALKLDFLDEDLNDVVFQDQILTGDDHNTLDFKAGLASAYDYAPGNKLGNAGYFPSWRTGYVCHKASFDYVKEQPFDFTSNLDQYSNKVLFVYSELNKAYGLSHAKLVSSAFPNVQKEEIADTGHEIPYFGWNRFYPIAKSYLNELK